MRNVNPWANPVIVYISPSTELHIDPISDEDTTLMHYYLPSAVSKYNLVRIEDVRIQLSVF